METKEINAREVCSNYMIITFDMIFRWWFAIGIFSAYTLNYWNVNVGKSKSTVCIAFFFLLNIHFFFGLGNIPTIFIEAFPYLFSWIYLKYSVAFEPLFESVGLFRNKTTILLNISWTLYKYYLEIIVKFKFRRIEIFFFC